MNEVTWYKAAAYCNWLSEQEGIPEEQWCYVPAPGGKYEEGMKLAPGLLPPYWLSPAERSGMGICLPRRRLTSRYYGETEELLDRYAWITKNSRDRSMLPCGTLKPNDLGLFDMLGNALEWCQDQGPIYYDELGEFAADKKLRSRPNSAYSWQLLDGIEHPPSAVPIVEGLCRMPV